MISLMDKQEIIISHFLEGKSQWEIHRQTGFDISYTTVCNYVREKINKEKEAFIRQEYKLGDVAEFDWGYV